MIGNATFMKPRNEICLPRCAAIDATTTFALAPMSVPLPPRQAPSARLHHIGSRFVRPIWPMSLMSGISVATNGMLSMNAEAMALIQRISMAVALTLPFVIWMASAASILMTPVSTSAPTSTNRPAKKKIASHSTFDSTFAIMPSLRVNVMRSRRPAPDSAHVAVSRPSVPCSTNIEIVMAMTNRHFFSSAGFAIWLRALRLMTFSCSSGCVLSSLWYSAISTASTTRKMTIATPVRFATKSMKFRPTALPIMMFGGSPMSVAVPPMFDARICEMRYGFTSTLSCAVMENVMGTVRSTVVTLSRRAEQTIVSAESAMSSLIGCALTFFAAQMARKLKRPVSLVMFTMIIMPMSRPSVLKSIWLIAVAWSMTPQRIMSDAPQMPTIVRCTFSEMISA